MRAFFLSIDTLRGCVLVKRVSWQLNAHQAGLMSLWPSCLTFGPVVAVLGSAGMTDLGAFLHMQQLF